MLSSLKLCYWEFQSFLKDQNGEVGECKFLLEFIGKDWYVMNSKRKMPSQGDVIWIDLNEVNSTGHEEKGRRPALVISTNKFNNMNGGIVKVIPITTSSHNFPFHIKLPEEFKVKGKLMIEQEREIDVVKRNYEVYCHLPSELVKKIIEIFLTCFKQKISIFDTFMTYFYVSIKVFLFLIKKNKCLT